MSVHPSLYAWQQSYVYIHTDNMLTVMTDLCFFIVSWWNVSSHREGTGTSACSQASQAIA